METKEIKFRPLRRGKDGKIIVASYTAWRKIKTADRYQPVTLIIDNQYKDMCDIERVHNHKGVNLFWEDYDPESIEYAEVLVLKSESLVSNKWKTDYGTYSSIGLDVDGVPAFSHQTPENIYNGRRKMKPLEPLTVKVVKWWFGWFLYQLENTTITYK